MSTRSLLERAGLDPTDNRMAVLDRVLEAGEAVTPQQLLAELAGTMNKVTLYRILDLLVESRLVEKHTGAGRSSHYCAGRGHGHFHCTRCGRVLCITLPLPMPTLDEITDMDGDAIAELHSMEIWLGGVCARCAKKYPPAFPYGKT